MVKLIQLLIFGHIHESYGYTNVTGVHSYNVSYTGSNFRETNNPVEIILDNKGKLK